MTDTRIVTSRVFACMRQLHKTLSGAAWTPHPTTSQTPLVVFGGTGVDDALETITLVGVPEDAARMDWGGMNPPVLNEEFALLIVVETEVQGSTNDVDDGSDAFTRLEELCDIIQAALRDQTTGQPIGGFHDLPAWNSVWKWHVSQVAPRIDPGHEGWIGSADLIVSFTTRI